jgi:hypothetical protein
MVHQHVSKDLQRIPDSSWIQTSSLSISSTKITFGRTFVYGTSNGIIGAFSVNNSAITPIWKIENEGNRGGITCVLAVDVSGDGVDDIIVARDDGFVFSSPLFSPLKNSSPQK